MALTNVDLDRIDGNSGSLANVSTSALNGGPLAGTRNRIINGDMRIDQRNAGASFTATTSNVYTLDRWRTMASQASKYSVQQNAGSVVGPAGFTNYLGVTSLAATTPGAGDFFWISQTIEAFNTADLNWGTANAQTVTLSFWVRSSLTGTFGGGLTNSDGAAVASTRCYPFTFSISAANTWEYKTITIAGDTTGTWEGSTNGRGIAVNFNLGAGSTYTATAGAWTGTSGKYVASGTVNVVGTNGATWQITGVQLEAGTVATPFERRSYGQELALCQRYYQTTALAGSATVYEGAGVMSGATQFPVVMRSAPTAGLISGVSASVRYPNGLSPQDNSNASPTLANAVTDPKGMWTQVGGTWGAATSGAVGVWGRFPSNNFISLSSEL